MTIEKASDTYKATINNVFPDLEIKDKQKTIDVFGDVLDGVFINFFESKYAKYVEEKPENIEMVIYLSKIPDGVDNFELWLKATLNEMSIQFTLELQKLLPPNIGFIYYAQLLDSHDFDAFFKRIKFKKNQKKPFQKGLTELFNEDTLKNFTLAMACSCIGLSNAANSLNLLWVQSALFEDEDINFILNEAKKLEAIRTQAAGYGMKGAENRWKKKKSIKAYAKSLRDKKTYKSSSHAAKSILKKVTEYADEIEEPFTDDFQAYDRICKWLREKSQ